jgi:hypothetical protein
MKLKELEKPTAWIIQYFFPISGIAGAIIELPSVAMKVYPETWRKAL